MGDILVFLTGKDDIDAAMQLLAEDSHHRNQGSSCRQNELIGFTCFIMHLRP